MSEEKRNKAQKCWMIGCSMVSEIFNHLIKQQRNPAVNDFTGECYGLKKPNDANKCGCARLGGALC
jgi:hypothetical protein